MQTTLVKKVSAAQFVWHWCLKTELAHSQTSEESLAPHTIKTEEKRKEIKNSYLSLRWGQLRERRERDVSHTSWAMNEWMEREVEKEDDDEEEEEGEQRRQCRWQAGLIINEHWKRKNWHTELLKKKKKTGDKCHHYIQRMRCHEAAFSRNASERLVGLAGKISVK